MLNKNHNNHRAKKLKATYNRQSEPVNAMRECQRSAEHPAKADYKYPYRIHC